ncbi:FUSC family protein [Agromyces aerolatus]|uniref:FUSC family protein n=1 Tax=Agromyces sp. LY-1074 TaxID=3074080 RepID=UPI002861438B|nr:MULTISPECIES: FUSC family protein [unclassified Agromyces]MDR5701846.1 FUSC family protein [Agromyces sp. LY-1074]MDR5708081.1 FUSC family protein [Agromyces sp. LY-1358]
MSKTTAEVRRKAALRARAWRADVTNPPRIVLALKTAAAAAIAWYLAPFVPFADSEYSYYAPLGVLLSMYPTLVDSARSGLQVIAGLAIGIALGLGGLAIVMAGAPGITAVAAVIAVGVWLGGLSALGSGRELVAVAGLFVLLIGGRNADEFSTSYLVTMAFGVFVGVVVNLLVFPPLYLQRASERLSALRDAVVDRLAELADAVEHDTVDPEAVERATDELSTTVAAVAAEVREAAASRRGNPRGLRRRADQQENADRLRALERIVFFTRDLADVLVSLVPAPGHEGDDDGERAGGHGRAEPGRESESLDAAARASLANAIRRTAELVAAPPGADDAAERLRLATDALDAATEAIDARPGERVSGIAADLTAVVCVRRIIEAARPFARARRD